MSFKDHFSGHAHVYAQYRPTYPAALFEFLATACPVKEMVWDCATGNGQAALSLADWFTQVYATDASHTQIANAVPHPRVSYAVAPEKASGLAQGSVDLVTVAQALHWFDLDAFYKEVQRVLKPHGRLAVWGYNLASSGLPLDAVVNRFYSEDVGSYWPPERHLIEKEYATIPFPFAEVVKERFSMPVPRSLPQLIGYLRSWSATKRFEADQGYDPVLLVEAELEALWPKDQEFLVFNTPIILLMGKRKG